MVIIIVACCVYRRRRKFTQRTGELCVYVCETSFSRMHLTTEQKSCGIIIMITQWLPINAATQLLCDHFR